MDSSFSGSQGRGELKIQPSSVPCEYNYDYHQEIIRIQRLHSNILVNIANQRDPPTYRHFLPFPMYMQINYIPCPNQILAIQSLHNRQNLSSFLCFFFLKSYRHEQNWRNDRLIQHKGCEIFSRHQEVIFQENQNLVVLGPQQFMSMTFFMRSSLLLLTWLETAAAEEADNFLAWL